MLARLKSMFASPEIKSLRTAQLIQLETGGRARWTPRDYAALTREGYIANAIVHRAVTIDGAPRELYALRPDRMRVVPGPDGWPEAYDYVIAGRSVRFEQNSPLPPILRLTQFHPLDDHHGLSSLEAAALAVELSLTSVRLFSGRCCMRCGSGRSLASTASHPYLPC